jgi:hypothetical protein
MHSRRESHRRHAPAALLGAVVLAATACTTIDPPDPASLKDPCTIHAARELGHLALFLPAADGSLVEYGFGDRIYLSTPGWPGRLWSVLLVFDPFPTPGALIREPRGDLRLARIRAAGTTLLTFAVERAPMLALRDRLDAEWAGGRPCSDWSALHSSETGYELWYRNCQDVAADWLRELGCRIGWFRIVPRWYEWSLRAP